MSNEKVEGFIDGLGLAEESKQRVCRASSRSSCRSSRGTTRGSKGPWSSRTGSSTASGRRGSRWPGAFASAIWRCCKRKASRRSATRCRPLRRLHRRPVAGHGHGHRKATTVPV